MISRHSDRRRIHRQRSCHIDVAAALATLLVAASSAAQTPLTERVSLTESTAGPGQELVNGAVTGTVSATGRYVLFDANDFQHPSLTQPFQLNGYLLDTVTGRTEVLTLTTSGSMPFSVGDRTGSITRGGTYAAFNSTTNGVVPGVLSFGDAAYLRLRPTPMNSLISGPSTAGHAIEGADVQLSGNGKFAVFASNYPFTSAGSNSFWQIYRKDLETEAVILLSQSGGGALGDFISSSPQISDDGNTVAFYSLSSNLHPQTQPGQRNVFAWSGGSLTLVTKTSTGAPSSGIAAPPRISGDGRWVIFASDAQDIVVPDNNPAADVFLHDLLTGSSEIVSVDSQGMQSASGGASGMVSVPLGNAEDVSFNGRYCAFQSAANDLVPVDNNPGTDVFLRDRWTGQTSLVSVTWNGLGANGDCVTPTVTDSGRVAYVSSATNLVQNDNNGSADVFLSYPGWSLEAVDGASQDANEEFIFMQGTQIAANATTLATGGTPTLAVTADGSARILLRFTADQPGTIQASVSTPIHEQGSVADALSTPPRTFASTGPMTQLVQTSQGWQGFVIYRAPDDFNQLTIGNQNDVQRTVEVTILHWPQGVAIPNTVQAEVEIFRPPLVLCHGLWSSPKTWTGPFSAWAAGTDPRFVTELVDYRGSAHSTFEHNAQYVSLHIERAQDKMRARGVACAKVDWVGHSMGAVLPRVEYRLAQRGIGRRLWDRPDNYGDGDINRIIMLNSPQWGSPLANLLWSIRGPAQGLFNMLGKPIGGAIRDLQEGSEQFIKMGTTDIPAHSIVCTGVEVPIATVQGIFRDLAPWVPGAFGKVFKGIDHFGQLVANTVFRYPVGGLREHDLIVLSESQEAGLSPHTSRLIDSSFSFNSLHMNVTGWDMAYQRIDDLLHLPIAASFSSSIPGPNLNPPRLAAPPHSRRSTSSATAGPVQVDDVEVIDLAGHASVQPNQQLNLEIRGKNGFVPIDTDLVTAEFSSESSTAPFTFSVNVPLTAVGDITFYGFGIDMANNRAVSLPLTIPVQVPATLQSIAATTSAVDLYHPLQTHQLAVLGSYSDGVTRDITRSATGTVYTSSNLAVASVSTDGLITVAGEGQATVTVTNPATAGSLVIPIDVTYGARRRYGAASVGSGNFYALASTGGEEPTIGNSNFKIVVDELLGGAQGSIFLGTAPANAFAAGIELHVDLATAVPVNVVATGPAGTPGVGTATLPLALPLDPTLVGVKLYFQGVFFDAGVAAGLSASNGLVITIQM